MQISYIAPVVDPIPAFALDYGTELIAEAIRPYLPRLATDATLGVTLKQIIKESIQEAMVEPFKAWFVIKIMMFMRFSYWLCFFTIAAGIMCNAFGIKRGKKVAIIAALSYVFLLAFYKVMSGGF